MQENTEDINFLENIGAIKPRTQILKEVPSGTIELQLGSDGVYLRFDCECVDALPYCQAQCCALIGTTVFPEELSNHLVSTSDVTTDNSGRYVMKRDSDGFCKCLDRQSRTCDIYENRPQTCRQYHCTRGAENRGWKLNNYVHRQSGI